MTFKLHTLSYIITALMVICYSKLNKAPTPSDNVYTLMEYVHQGCVQVYESGGGYIKRSKLINLQYVCSIGFLATLCCCCVKWIATLCADTFFALVSEFAVVVIYN